MDAAALESEYRCGLFSVYKSETVDRQIVNPIPENSRCFQISDDTKTLSHDCMLGQLCSAPGMT
eukprot:6120250-Amphidinium_carterae.2